MEQFVAEIVEDATGRVVYQSKPNSRHNAERIDDGLSINLNHAEFTTRIVPEAEAAAEVER